MTAQRVSIIIEWENVLLSDMDRCRAMLKELQRQIRELEVPPATVPSGALSWLAFPFQIIVVYNRDRVPAALVSRELEQVFPADQPRVQVELAPSSGLRYYELKNFGAQRADGGILLFLDSDVIPEADWLKSLLGAFDDPAVEVVCGATYVDPSGLFGKVFALTWIFPMRSSRTSLERVPRFFANNVAFRSKTFQRFPFPRPDGGDRGACGRLAGILKEHALSIYRHNGARVSHPAPNGLRHFITRGLAHGRDDVFNRRRNQRIFRPLREIWRQINYFFRDSARSLSSIARNRKAVGLSWIETPVAGGIALCYYQLRLLGALLTQIHPGFMKNHFRI